MLPVAALCVSAPLFAVTVAFAPLTMFTFAVIDIAEPERAAVLLMLPVCAVWLSAPVALTAALFSMPFFAVIVVVVPLVIVMFSALLMLPFSVVSVTLVPAVRFALLIT